MIEKMNLKYIANVRIPTEKAHGVHMMKMCEAFSSIGLNVEFVIPMRFSKIKENPFDYYNVRENFKIKRLPSIDFISFIPWLGYWVQYLSYLIALFISFAFVDRGNVVVHTREYLVAWLFEKLGYKTVYEAHRVLLKEKSFFRILENIETIITNSEGVAEKFRKEGFKTVLALSNAVDIKEFNFDMSKNEIRSQLNLPEEKKIAMYAGHLYNWKGIDTVMDAARNMNDMLFVFVGGTQRDISKYKEEKLPNALFLGHKPKKDIPFYLKSANILLLPNSPVSEESVTYTSPMKLFEYMASGIPIVASDLPSTREILNNKNSILVLAGDPIALKKGIKESIDNPKISQKLANQAKEDVKSRTWENRARKIVEFSEIHF